MKFFASEPNVHMMPHSLNAVETFKKNKCVPIEFALLGCLADDCDAKKLSIFV